MNEADTMSALAAIGDTTSSYIALWVTTTFGYLTVAYFIGKDLTRFQVAAITGLYIVSSLLFSISAIAHSDTWIRVSTGTPYQEFPLYGFAKSVWIPGMRFIVVAGMCVSLYFMHDIRARAAKRTDT